MITLSIPLTQGKITLIDEADAERVLRHRWSAWWNGTRWYAHGRVDGKVVTLHRFLMDAQPGQIVDHRNGNGLDNRRSINLRFATKQQNAFNIARRGGSSSRHKGVSWDPSRGKWQARINLNGKTIHLGRFAVESDAAAAYERAAQNIQGEFARSRNGGNDR